MHNSLENFKPKLLNDLIRIGRAFDGGYVINERSIHSSQYLVSFGVNDDWSFEAEFFKRKPDIKVLCFDHSVSKKVFLNKIIDAIKDVFRVESVLQALSLNIPGVRLKLGILKYSIKTYLGFSFFFAKRDVRFCSKGISSERSQSFVTLSEAFQMISRQPLPENSVFIKMDIEGSEYRVIPPLRTFEEYINGMVIEFHDLDIRWTDFLELMTEVKVNFEITHIHGNNFGGLIPNSSSPKILEITFLKRSLIQEEHSDCETAVYPIPDLDRPNNPSEKDYPLFFLNKPSCRS